MKKFSLKKDVHWDKVIETYKKIGNSIVTIAIHMLSMVLIFLVLFKFIFKNSDKPQWASAFLSIFFLYSLIIFFYEIATTFKIAEKLSLRWWKWFKYKKKYIFDIYIGLGFLIYVAIVILNYIFNSRWSALVVNDLNSNFANSVKFFILFGVILYSLILLIMIIIFLTDNIIFLYIGIFTVYVMINAISVSDDTIISLLEQKFVIYLFDISVPIIYFNYFRNRLKKIKNKS